MDRMTQINASGGPGLRVSSRHWWPATRAWGRDSCQTSIPSSGSGCTSSRVILRRLAKGLPQKDTYFTVQRDGMTIDDCARPALYFVTTTGQLWIGRDGGESWECLFPSLPPIHCVKAAVV